MIGKDEMNLAEYQKAGFVCDVFLSTMWLGAESQFQAPQIKISKYKIIKTIGIIDKGTNYHNISKALITLTEPITIPFHDINTGKTYVKTIQILKEVTDKYVVFGDEIYASIKNHYNDKKSYSKDINLDFYFSLSSNNSKKLFRYLDKKKFDGLDDEGNPKEKCSFVIGLRNLCQNHIGIDKKYSSEYLRWLSWAHKELLNKGFLEKIEIEEQIDGSDLNLIYYFKKTNGKKNGNNNNNGKKVEIITDLQNEKSKPSALPVTAQIPKHSNGKLSQEQMIYLFCVEKSISLFNPPDGRTDFYKILVIEPTIGIWYEKEYNGKTKEYLWGWDKEPKPTTKNFK